MSVVHVVPRVEDGSGSGTLPFAFRNNTSEGISHVDWTGTARSGGSIVATGSTIPAQVQRWVLRMVDPRSGALRACRVRGAGSVRLSRPR